MTRARVRAAEVLLIVVGLLALVGGLLSGFAGLLSGEVVDAVLKFGGAFIGGIQLWAGIEIGRWVKRGSQPFDEEARVGRRVATILLIIQGLLWGTAGLIFVLTGRTPAADDSQPLSPLAGTVMGVFWIALASVSIWSLGAVWPKLPPLQSIQGPNSTTKEDDPRGS